MTPRRLLVAALVLFLVTCVLVEVYPRLVAAGVEATPLLVVAPVRVALLVLSLIGALVAAIVRRPGEASGRRGPTRRP